MISLYSCIAFSSSHMFNEIIFQNIACLWFSLSFIPYMNCWNMNPHPISITCFKHGSKFKVDSSSIVVLCRITLKTRILNTIFFLSLLILHYGRLTLQHTKTIFNILFNNFLSLRKMVPFFSSKWFMDGLHKTSQFQEHAIHKQIVPWTHIEFQINTKPTQQIKSQWTFIMDIHALVHAT